MPLSKPPVEQVKDASGKLIYIFDPLPTLPTETDPPLLSFKAFKPRGIQRPFGGWKSGEVELDGEGIPTIPLTYKHEVEPPGEKKKGKKKKKNRGRGKVTGTSVPLSELTSDWERLEHATVNFMPDHPNMTVPHIKSLFDHFRLFVGLLGRALQAAMSEKNRQYHADTMADQNEAGDASDADSDFGDDTGVASRTQGDTLEEDYEAIFDRIHADSEKLPGEPDAQEKRVKSFLADPVTSMKVFLSSYFFEKNLHL